MKGGGMEKELAIIGCGNMGSAMLKGIVGAGLVAPENIMISDVHEESQQQLASELGCMGTCNNREAVSGARTVIIAVKPQQLDKVVRGFAKSVGENTVVVSIAAGVTLARLEGLLGSDCKIVRTMPNLPAMVGEAMSGLSPNANVTDEELAYVKSLFEGFGKAEVVPEDLMDAVVAVSGSAPAYVSVLIEAMADAAVMEGMPRKQAYRFAEQSVLGTAKYLLETGTHPAELKDLVSSPAGTAIQAVATLEEDGLRSTIIHALTACAQRSRELA